MAGCSLGRAKAVRPAGSAHSQGYAGSSQVADCEEPIQKKAVDEKNEDKAADVNKRRYQAAVYIKNYICSICVHSFGLRSDVLNN